MRKLKIALLSPFHGGSHKQWAENLIAHSTHDIELYSMPGVYWKWRMHASSIHFSKMLKNYNYPEYDIFLTTDMMDQNAFRGLLHPHYQHSKFVLYFHENQLTYPWSEKDPDPALDRDRHYAFINYISALGADHILFNSSFHKDEFTTALETFLFRFPDYKNLDSIPIIRSKSQVIYPGISIQQESYSSRPVNKIPIILWNHRWEYDKNPDGFYNALQYLRHHKATFHLILLGDSFTQSPPAYEKIKQHFSQQIIFQGFVHDRSEYFELISKSDVLPVFNIQEFFGISTLEAIASGVFPLLPNRLVYPEHIPAAFHEKYLYNNEEEINQRLLKWIQNPLSLDREIWEISMQYRWETIIEKYDKFFISIV